MNMTHEIQSEKILLGRKNLNRRQFMQLTAAGFSAAALAACMPAAAPTGDTTAPAAEAPAGGGEAAPTGGTMV
jgi:hypothetical protein